MEIPLFPLHAVLVPGIPLPLHVFEPRYRQLVADCLAAGTAFGVVALSAGREVGGGAVSFATIGTLAEIREVSRHPDGRLDIVTMGTTRFRLHGVDATREPYLVGSGELLPEPLGDPAAAAALARRVRARFVRYLELLQPDFADAEVEGDLADGDDTGADAPPRDDAATSRDAAPPQDAGADREAALDRLEEIAARIAPEDDPVALGYVVAGLVQMELPRRQRLLETATAEERLGDLDALLSREVALLARRLGPYALDPRPAALRRN